MPHLILWKQAVGGGAGGHQEGQHVRPLQVHQEHVQQHIWHNKNLFLHHDKFTETIHKVNNVKDMTMFLVDL